MTPKNFFKRQSTLKYILKLKETPIFKIKKKNFFKEQKQDSPPPQISIICYLLQVQNNPSCYFTEFSSHSLQWLPKLEENHWVAGMFILTAWIIMPLTWKSWICVGLVNKLSLLHLQTCPNLLCVTWCWRKTKSPGTEIQ